MTKHTDTSTLMGPWLAFATNQFVRRAGAVAVFLGIMLMGTVIGGWVAAPAPEVAVAQEGGTPFCEHDACVELDRRWWFDFKGCADAPDSGGGCAMGSDDCSNYECEA